MGGKKNQTAKKQKFSVLGSLSRRISLLSDVKLLYSDFSLELYRDQNQLALKNCRLHNRLSERKYSYKEKQKKIV